MNDTAIIPSSPDKNLPAQHSSRETSGWLARQVDFMTVWLSNHDKEQGKPQPESNAKRAIRIGYISALTLFGFFGIWSATAPLDSAAIAIGKVILDSNKKTIQHLEGGIVDAILVREGQEVKEGDILVKLDETTAKARYDLLKNQYYTAIAAEARLVAERDSKETISFSEDLLKREAEDIIVAESLDSQRRLFKSRKDNLEGRISILRQKIGQFKEEIKGLESQSVSATRQIQILNGEIADVQMLVNQGNAPKPRLLSLQREQQRLTGQRGEYGAMIARAEQSIGEAELEIINTRNDFLNKVIQELKETQVTLADLQERIRASEDTFNRINIVAPIAGTIVDLKAHTVGGVIRPGDKIMDIIPSDDKLIVEALVLPQDIDVVQKGLPARIRLSAYKSRFVPPITGKVVQVSADRFDDPQTGASYYKARVEVDSDELKAIEGVELYPGMPSDVLIVTGSRTLLAYLFSPIRDSFSKSFREE